MIEKFRNRWFNIFEVLLFVLTLVACSLQGTPTDKAQPTTQPVAETHVNTPSKTSIVPTSTQIPTFTITPQPTSTDQPYHCSFVWHWEDPTGDWIGLSIQCQNPGLPRVDVLGSNKKHWVFEGKSDYVIQYRHYKWSDDGNYLYFYSVNTRPSDTYWYSYQVARSFFRMDLRNGLTDELLPELLDVPYNSISLSPDETQIVYLSLSGKEKKIGIRDIRTGEEKTALIEGFNGGGNFLWSTINGMIAFVGANIVYITTSDGHYYPENVKETILLLNVESMKVSQVYSIDTKSPTLKPIAWENGNLIISDKRHKYLTSIDIKNTRVTNFYPTPTPNP